MNQTQSYQPTTFFNQSQTVTSNPLARTSNHALIVFETWSSFNQWVENQTITDHSFLEQLNHYLELQEVECQLNTLSSFLQIEETLSLDTLREVWQLSQTLLTRVWAFPHQWVQTVSIAVQTFLSLWQTKNHLTDTRFKALGKLPDCCLNESDWHQFCLEQEQLCLVIEPYLMCLDEETVACYERAMHWVDGTESLEEVNQQVMEGEWEVNRDFFSNFEGKSLDSVQSQAVLSDHQTTLVMGGAGSGKTMTLVAKINYLIQRKRVPTEEILILGSTQDQLSSLKKKLGSLASRLQFKTYHKFALELITKKRGSTPTLAEDGLLNHCVRQVLMSWFSNSAQSETLAYYFSKELGIPRGQYQGATLKEFYELSEFKELQRFNISSWQDIECLANNLGEHHLTLKHEWVKSNEEVLLANFLFLNGINYQYEPAYKHPTSDEHYRQYHPDFYLPDYDLYLEHFGLNEQHKAIWLNREEAKKYEESVAWKRQLHQIHQTQLIETYSYEFNQRDWATTIRAKLEKQGVTFQRVELYDVLKHLANNQRPRYYRFSTLIKTYLELLYKQGKTIADIQALVQSESQKREETSTQIFYQLLLDVAILYQSRLEELNLLDLNQLFTVATAELKHEPFSYRYVLTNHIEDCTTMQFNFLLSLTQTYQLHWWMTADNNQAIGCLQDTCGMTFRKNYQSLLNHFEKTVIFNLEMNYRLLPTEESFFNQSTLNHLSAYPKKEKALNQTKKFYTYTYHFDEAAGLEATFQRLSTQATPLDKIAIVGTSLNHLMDSLPLKIYKRFKKGIQLKHLYYPHLQLFYFHPKQVKGIEVDHLIMLELSEMEEKYRKTILPPAFNRLLPYVSHQLKEELQNIYYLGLTRATKTVHLILGSQNNQTFLKEFIENQTIESTWIEKENLSFLNFIPQFNQQLLEFPLPSKHEKVAFRQIG